MDLKTRRTFVNRCVKKRDQIDRLETKLKEKGKLTPLESERLDKYRREWSTMRCFL